MAASGTRRERMVRVRDNRLFVREQGEGVPLLLINGLGSSVEMWGEVESRLASTARTIAYDLPGSGRSPTSGPVSISSLAREAAALLKALGYEHADVLGFSLGGLVAQQLAHDYPRVVRRMALAGTACGWGSLPPTRQALALLGMPIRYHSPSLYRRTNHLLSEGDRQLLRRLPNLTESRLRHPPPLLGYAYQLAAGSMWTSLPWLAAVRTPTVVLAGIEDHVVPSANAVQLARLLPESRLHLVPGGGHLFIFDPQGPAIHLVADFFAGPRHEDTRAWSDGTAVVTDEPVDTAFADAHGTFPQRVFSDAYRRFVVGESRRTRGGDASKV